TWSIIGIALGPNKARSRHTGLPVQRLDVWGYGIDCGSLPANLNLADVEHFVDGDVLVGAAGSLGDKRFTSGARRRAGELSRQPRQAGPNGENSDTAVERGRQEVGANGQHRWPDGRQVYGQLMTALAAEVVLDAAGRSAAGAL